MKSKFCGFGVTEKLWKFRFVYLDIFGVFFLCGDAQLRHFTSVGTEKRSSRSFGIFRQVWNSHLNINLLTRRQGWNLCCRCQWVCSVCLWDFWSFSSLESVSSSFSRNFLISFSSHCSNDKNWPKNIFEFFFPPLNSIPNKVSSR